MNEDYTIANMSDLDLEVIDLIKEADSAMSDIRYEEAEKLYKKALEKDKKSIAAWLGLADIARASLKYDEALILLNEALILNKANPVTHEKIGEILFRSGKKSNNKSDLRKAITCFNRALALGSDMPEDNKFDLRLKVAQAFSLVNEYAESIRLCDKLLEDFPDNVNTLILKAENLWATGNLEGAEAVYNSVMAIHPHSSALVNGYSTILMSLGRYDDLISYLQNNLDKTDIDDFYKIPVRLQCAVVAYCEENTALFNQLIDELTNTKLLKSNFMNKENLVVFYNILRQMNAYKKNNSELYDETDKNCKDLYVFGESHCLPSVGLHVALKGKKYKCKARLIFGVQARHIGMGPNNPYKAALMANAAKIPDNSEVLLTFGEIDCRRDYGIMPYLKKTGKLNVENLRTAIEENIGDYINACMRIFYKKGCSINFYGVSREKIQLTLGDNDLHKYTLETFNEVLKEKTKQFNVGFVDIYSLTNNIMKGENTEYKEKCFLDINHVTPRIFKEACENYYVSEKSGSV